MTTASTFQRLLRYPHAAVFDKAPGAELALRLRHPGGSSWRIADHVLTAEAGGQTFLYLLDTMTVGQLADRLRDDGFDVPLVSADFVDASAMVLVEGRGGDQGGANGDHVNAYTNLLYAILNGYGREVRDAEYAVQQALRQMVITQAEGEWLDLWGTLYGDQREADEADADYAQRIPEEAFRLRVNAFAIEDAVFAKTGYRITIDEPWKQLMRASVSALSEDHHLYDGERWGPHLIQPVAATHVDWTKVLPVIERNKAAGVIVIGPSESLPVVHLSFGVRRDCASFSRIDTRASYALGDFGGLLSVNMALSDYDVKINYAAQMAQVISVSNQIGAETEQSFGPLLALARASFRLSDGYALGELNCRFGGAITDTFADASEALSGTETEDGYRLSDFAYKTVVTPIDYADEDLRASFVAFSNARSASVAMRGTMRHLVTVGRHARVFWTGAWDGRRWTYAPKFSAAQEQRPRP